MAGPTDIEVRMAIMERRLAADEAKLAQALALAAAAAQDAGLGGGDGGAAKYVSIDEVFTTSTVSVRVGNVTGVGTYRLVNNFSRTLTDTGDTGDAGLTAENLTGGSAPIPSGAFGLVATKANGKKYFIVLDCNYNVSPGTPATPTAAQSGAQVGTMGTGEGTEVMGDGDGGVLGDGS